MLDYFEDRLQATAATPINTRPQLPSTTRLEIDCVLTYMLDAPCEFVLLIQAAHTPTQHVLHESFELNPPTPYRNYTDAHLGNRFLRFEGQAGPLTVTYRAGVERLLEPVNEQALEVAVRAIPDDILRFVLPTRYCESDLLGPVAQQLFGALLPGYARVQAITDWVQRHIAYRIGSTNSTTTARDVFVQRSGVCRDFAHLAVSFCRALNIPARLVCGYASFPEPPPDFHAIFEAYLGDQWVLFDPTGMAPVAHVVRTATGRDAKDVAFATLFGPARMLTMSPDVTVVSTSSAPSL